MSGKVTPRAWSLLLFSKVHYAGRQAGFPLLVCAEAISGALLLSTVLHWVLVTTQAPSAPQSFGSINLLQVFLIAADFYSIIATGETTLQRYQPAQME